MEHEEGVRGGVRFMIFLLAFFFLYCGLSGLKLTSFTGPGVIL